MKPIKIQSTIQKLLLIGLVLLGGCTALKQNVNLTEPTSGERARVRVAIPNEGPYRGVRAFPNSTCPNRNLPNNGNVVNKQIALGFEKSLNGKTVGIPQTDNSKKENYIYAEIYVTANQPITFTHMRAQDTVEMSRVGTTVTQYFINGCQHSVQFKPVANKDYELIFGATKANASKPNQCGAILFSLNGNTPVEDDALADANPKCK